MAQQLGLCLLLALVASGAVAETAGAEDTPVARVTNLLKDMSKTLEKEMDEDEAVYKEMACWCSSGDYDKKTAIEKSKAKIQELGSSIDSLFANSARLSAQVKELEGDASSDKGALATATKLREKQMKQFDGRERDSMQTIDNLEKAVKVLGKHHDSLLQSTVEGDATSKSESDSWSFLEVDSDSSPYSQAHEQHRDVRMLSEFMRRNDISEDADVVVEQPVAPHKFLQQAAGEAAQSTTWSTEDVAFVKHAFKSAAAFLQSRQGSSYELPVYEAQSGEVLGYLKQMKDDMEADQSEAKKLEEERAEAFQKLRTAKQSEITDGEKMAEQKKDELATTDMKLAQSKDDLAKERQVLKEDEVFLRNLGKMCRDADSNFEQRKKARMTEMQAVSDTIDILQGDEARDAMSRTFSFVQLASRRTSSRRAAAAETLRRAASGMHSSELSVLAASVELDAFKKVKDAMDKMMFALKDQQKHEVRKNDFCEDKLHENKMATSKADDLREDLEAKISDLESSGKALQDEIDDAKDQIAQLQLELQTASRDRKKENADFQQTVADQLTTIAVLEKAKDKLASYYDLLQTKQHSAAEAAAAAGQTPPNVQKEYKANSSGGGGVLEMIEKLIEDCKDLRTKAVKGESEGQTAYEKLIKDTNDSIEALQKEIISKKGAFGDERREKIHAKVDQEETVRELSNLGKYAGELHKDCDHLLKNFDLRQKAIGEEVEALQKAQQILDGAEFD